MASWGGLFLALEKRRYTPEIDVDKKVTFFGFKSELSLLVGL